MVKNLSKDIQALGLVLEAVRELDKAQQQWVFASAMSNLGLTSLPVGRSPALLSSVGKNNSAVELSDDVSPKEFLRIKNPQSDVQKIACLAFYLTNHRGQPHFKTTDLTALNVEAAGTKISNPSQAVSNATKQNHYLTAAGGGKKQITSIGEDVVQALPDQESARSIEKNKSKKRRSSKKSITRD